jgi:Trk K+ transport system NAD-binding subunit
VQVISGVQPGEMVIVEGQQTLKDGDTLVVKGKK